MEHANLCETEELATNSLKIFSHKVKFLHQFIIFMRGKYLQFIVLKTETGFIYKSTYVATMKTNVA